MCPPPKYLLFVVNPVTSEVLLVNHRAAAVGANQWNGVLCPSSAELATAHPSSMIIYEIFSLTQGVYAANDWSCVGDVSYNHGGLNCQILVSMTSDLSFAASAGGMDSVITVANRQKLQELAKSKQLAPYVAAIVERIFADIGVGGAPCNIVLVESF